jgi:threonine aldolase
MAGRKVASLSARSDIRSMHSQAPARHFASDNNAGICPEVLAALAEANQDHAPGYGDDPWTRRAERLFQDIFETSCEVFFVFNGTAANCLALWSACESFHGVICHRHAHIETDECGAPGFFMHGVTLLPAETPDGKLTPATVAEAFKQRHDFHAPQPRALSLTQATELGTVYSAGELGALTELARELKLTVHVDGARFANAVAGLGASPADLTWRAGVDVLCLGGTKNGAAGGEAVVFFDAALAENFRRRCKQSGQLASKMRFLSAQWIGLLENGAWLRHAQQANDTAAYLARELEGLSGVRIAYPREANAVFVHLPDAAAAAVAARGWRFYNDVGPGGAARLMCSWDSTAGDVDAFIGDLKEALP